MERSFPLKTFALLLVLVTAPGAVWGSEQALAGASPLKNGVLEPAVSERFEYYEVCGCTEKDLQCDLKLKAIRCDDGRKYDSVTNWKVTWKNRHKKAPGSCATEDFTATVDITFRVPKWSRDTKATQQLADKWDAYVTSILAHEKGHRDRAVAAAGELTRAIELLPPGRTCQELDKEVNRVARDRLHKLFEEQAEYDKETGHGRSQGVAFP